MLHLFDALKLYSGSMSSFRSALVTVASARCTVNHLRTLRICCALKIFSCCVALVQHTVNIDYITHFLPTTQLRLSSALVVLWMKSNLASCICAIHLKSIATIVTRCHATMVYRCICSMHLKSVATCFDQFLPTNLDCCICSMHSKHIVT